MRPHLLHLALALAPLAAASCSTPTAQQGETPASEPAPVEAPRRIQAKAAPRSWQELEAFEFEALVRDLEPGPWEPAAVEEFALALGRQDLASVRAAVLLARGEARSRDALLARLEARIEGPARESDAGDVVAAAALARWPEPDVLARLGQLALGPAPHPDLEVRVECAVTALAGGVADVTPFLLRVLTAGTPAELQHPIDWTPTETLAWAKMRASDALAKHAGLDLLYQPDGSFDQQLADVERLRAALEPGS